MASAETEVLYDVSIAEEIENTWPARITKRLVIPLDPASWPHVFRIRLLAA
jgi:hypothetical protein